MSESASNSGASDDEIWDQCVALGREGKTLKQRGDVPGAIAKYNEIVEQSTQMKDASRRRQMNGMVLSSLGNAYAYPNDSSNGRLL